MVGDKIRQTRESKKMSQEDLSDRSGVSRQTISSLENGKLQSVRTGTLENLAKALDVSVRIFFE